METEKRTVYFDNDLNIEAYHFEGIMQKFPNHFHEHYVIGFVESGQRFLTCKNKEYVVKAGDLLLFNPLDAHTCEQADGKPLDWRCLNIAQSCNTYDSFIEKMGCSRKDGLRYFGIAICGDKKLVNQLTGSMPLLR